MSRAEKKRMEWEAYRAAVAKENVENWKRMSREEKEEVRAGWDVCMLDSNVPHSFHDTVWDCHHCGGSHPAGYNPCHGDV